MKTKKVIYWIATGLLSAMMLMSAGMYLFNTDEVKGFFVALNYPTYLVYPLAVAKILAVTAILTRKSATLKEWAYAGLFFDFVLAGVAHFNANDGGAINPAIAVILLLVSYILQKRLFNK